MKYYSETLNKVFDTEDACVKAETAELKKQEEAKALQAKKDADRKAAAEKVNAARKEMVEAQKRYYKELDEFCKTYKNYHLTINSDADLPHLWDWFSIL